MSQAEAIGRPTGFGRLLARDASLLPAVIVAGAATAFTVISPPAWLARPRKRICLTKAPFEESAI